MKVMGILCSVFAVIDFAGMYLHYDITGVSWSPAVAAVVGMVLIKSAGSGDKTSYKGPKWNGRGPGV